MQKRHTLLLIAVILLAFALRISGIMYGLPLWLINDEPSTVLGALKMMELKSVIPAFHTQEMSSVLYYPPYISYLYLLPFSIIAGFQTFVQGLSVSEIIANLSPYFIVARLISILVGLVCIWLIYEITRSLFESKKAALVSTTLAATSLINISLSMSARHWIFISLIYSLAFYFLFKKRSYSWFSIVAAIGMGVSSISVFLFALFPLWYFVIEKNTLASLKKDLYSKKFWIVAIITGIIAILPSVLYPMSNGFIVDITSGTSKSIIGIILSPFRFIGLLMYSEPILVISFLIGFITLCIKNKRMGLTFGAFIYFYSIVYYILFRYESRFLLPILPLIYSIAGYTFISVLRNKYYLVLLAIPLCASVMLSYLALHNDSRIHAIDWVYENTDKKEKILTYGSQLRIPTTANAIAELRSIEPNALRKIDTAEEKLNKMNLHSLNMYTVQNKEFLAKLPDYVRKNGYTLYMIEEGNSDTGIAANNIPQQKVLASFGTNPRYSIATSEFPGNLRSLFKTSMLGPVINIYR